MKHFFLVLTLCVMGLLIYLGVWQLHRADEKRAMLSHHVSMHHRQPISLNQSQQNIKYRQYQPLSIQGTYDNAHIFLLDNQFYQHQLGYEVIQPFLFDQHYILVSRGWIKASPDRKILPELPAITGEQTIQGAVYFPTKAFSLSRSGTSNHEDNPVHAGHIIAWPKRIEAIDLSEIHAWLTSASLLPLREKVPVGRMRGIPYPFIVRLAPNMPNGFVRDWPIISMSPEKHIGYAVQWFAMALTIFIIYLVLRIKQKAQYDKNRH